MIQIKEEKIAEMMFDIWHNSDSLKNPVMVGEYIANKLKAAISVTRCCTELKDKKALTFDEWLNLNNYAKSSEAKYLDENANWFTEKQLLKMYNDIF
jgi:hypothetical protein